MYPTDLINMHQTLDVHLLTGFSIDGKNNRYTQMTVLPKLNRRAPAVVLQQGNQSGEICANVQFEVPFKDADKASIV